MMKRSFIAAILLCVPLLVTAQQAVIGNSLVGTIQLLDFDTNIVTISSQDYGYDEALFQVFYDGNVVPYTILDEGIVVRFYIDSQRMITRMELLGPIDKVRAFFES
jgi:hypothetical protein